MFLAMSLTIKRWLQVSAFLLTLSVQAQDLQRSLFGPSIAELRPIAEAGDAVAQYKLGAAYDGHFDRTNALIWYRRAARQGYAEAQYSLGTLVKGSAETLKWTTLAANQNHLFAQLRLGHIYET